MPTRDELAEKLRASRRALLQAVFSASPEAALIRPIEGEWSVLEVLAHLVDTDLHYTEQALAMRADSGQVMVYFDDAAWKRDHAQVRETPLSDVLARLEESHEAMQRHLASMTNEELNAPALHPRGIPYTVGNVFLRLQPHDENHTRQIEQILAAI